jgi:hypothetical protein
MRWRSLHGRFHECPTPPYLLDKVGMAAIEADLVNVGFESLDVDVSDCRSERAIGQRAGRALGFPDTFRGGWDAFFDLLHDQVLAPGRVVVVNVVDASDLSHVDMRLFARTVWMLMRASEAVELAGAGSAQLEFLFWGAWPSRP